jgi:hypothetical protein
MAAGGARARWAAGGRCESRVDDYGHAANAIEICAREMWERTWEIKLRRGVGEKKNYSNGV